MSTLKLIVSIALIDVPYERQSLFVQLTSPCFPRGGSIMCHILLILDNLLNPWTISIQETGIYVPPGFHGSEKPELFQLQLKVC